MQIAIVSHDVVRRIGHGRVTYELVKYLLDRGHKIHLYADRIELDLYRRENLVIHHIPVGFRRPILLKIIIFYIVCSLKLLTKKCDIIHLQGPVCFTHTNVITCHFCSNKWRKLGLDKGIYHHLYTLFHCLLEKISYQRKYTTVIAISQRIKDELVKFVGVDRERIHIIYNGVDIEKFKPDALERRKFRNRMGVSEDDFLVLFVGDTKTKRKGIDYLIHAIAGIQDKKVKLFVVGDTIDGASCPIAASRIISLGLTDNMTSVYNGVDCLVFPTLYDPFGLVVLEAMSCGLPVIVSRLAGCSELIIDGKDGLILYDPTDRAEIKKKVVLLKDDKDFRLKMARMARGTAVSYSWGLAGYKIEKLYRSYCLQIDFASELMTQ